MTWDNVSTYKHIHWCAHTIYELLFDPLVALEKSPVYPISKRITKYTITIWSQPCKHPQYTIHCYINAIAAVQVPWNREWSGRRPAPAPPGRGPGQPHRRRRSSHSCRSHGIGVERDRSIQIDVDRWATRKWFTYDFITYKPPIAMNTSTT